MCAKLPFSPLTRDRFGPSRMFASPRGGRAHQDHVLSHALPSHALHHEEASERSIHAGRVGRKRWLRASMQQLYAASVALAAAVVLLWRGSLVLLAVGALLLGLVIVAVFLLLARRVGVRRSGPGPHRRRRAP